jgi:deoxycytidylate deaminase
MKEKVKYVCDVPCPNCGKIVIIKRKVTILTPAEPAEKEETYFAEKGIQTTLNIESEQETSAQ